MAKNTRNVGNNNTNMVNNVDDNNKTQQTNNNSQTNNGQLNGATSNNQERLDSFVEEKNVQGRRGASVASIVTLNISTSILKVDTKPSNILVPGFENVSKYASIANKTERQHMMGMVENRMSIQRHNSVTIPVSKEVKATDIEEMIWEFNDHVADIKDYHFDTLEKAFRSKGTEFWNKYQVFKSNKANGAAEISQIRSQLKKSRGLFMTNEEFTNRKYERRYSETGYIIKITIAYKHDLNMAAKFNIDPFVDITTGEISYPANKYKKVAGSNDRYQSNTAVRTIIIPFFSDSQLDQVSKAIETFLQPLVELRDEIRSNEEIDQITRNDDSDGYNVPESWENKSNRYEFISISEYRAFADGQSEASSDELSDDTDDLSLDWLGSDGEEEE